MKILMIGNKESGKTTYMASAFGLLNDGVAGFHISGDSSTETWYRRVFNTIKTGAYPNASDKRSSHNFELVCLGKKILDFEWVDYNGGIIRTIDADELMNDIDNCDGVMLFFDAKSLRENTPSTHQLRRILTLIAKKLGKLDVPLFSVILVVTKVDMVSTDEFFESITPLNAFVENAKENNKIYTRIVPVSCTQNGFFNVELPILDILDSGLRSSYLDIVNSAIEHKDKAIEYNNKRGFLDWIDSKLSGVSTYGEMADRQVAELQKKISLYESIEEPMKKLRSYIQDYELKWPTHNYVKETPKPKSGLRRLIKF